jgi:hypothetical protein
MAGVKGRSGGRREGAGRKPAPPVYSEAAALLTDDPDEFLRGVMRDPKVEIKHRIEAAKALKRPTGGAKGKREQQVEAAEQVMTGGRVLTPDPAPTRSRLTVVK